MKQKNKIKGIAFAAVTAALYVVLTYLAAVFGLSGGAVQIRFSESLTVLPVFTPYAIPGLFVGCLLANILTGCAFWDIVFGSLATLIGAVGTYCLRRYKILPFVPPVLANSLTVPPVLMYVYGANGTLPYFFFTVLAGELISCCLLGGILKKGFEKRRLSQYF